MKNKLLLGIVRFLRRWIATNDSAEQRILVVSSTALGDSLWGAPAIESLRASFPEAHIALFTSPVGEEALRHNPWVDRTYVVREPMLSRVWGLWRDLRKEKFQDVVILHASQRLMLPLCALLGAKRIVATAGINKGLDALLTDAVPAVSEHEIERRLKLIHRIGARTHSRSLSFFDRCERATQKGRPLVALHPGSSDSFKRWPASHFVAVGNTLTEWGAEVLITGTASERALMQDIASQVPNSKVLSADSSLREFAETLQQLDLLISNDTGPVHLAIALKTPVIALYAPTNPKLCGPYEAEHAHAIAKPRTCDPCLGRKCRRPFCLMQIGPQEVIDAAVKLLGERKAL